MVSGSSANALGSWAATGACAASIAYGVPQVMQVLGLLPQPLDRVLIFVPSLALAPLFVVALAVAAGEAASGARAWRMAALALGILYAGLVSVVYVIQLGVVIPEELAGRWAAVANLACCDFRAPMTAIDLLGYSFMSLALLVLAPTIGSVALNRLLLATGALAPAIFFQLFWPKLIFVAAIWLITFPAAMLLLARELGSQDTGEPGTGTS